MKIIIISGGTGYIGRTLSYALLNAGYRVMSIDRNYLVGCDSVRNNPNYHQYNLDLTSDHDVKDYLPDLNYDNKGDEFYGFIHLAAWKDLTASYSNPYEYYRNNINATISALNLAHLLGCKVFLNASSAAVYPDDASGFTSESDAIVENCASPYGYAKLICERIVTDICKQYNMRGHSLRYSNPIGCLDGIAVDVSESMFGNIINHLDDGEFTIYGDNYNTPDGTCIRDYIDIRDLVDAHIYLLKHEPVNKLTDYSVLNVGTGRAVSCLEACRKVRSITENFTWNIGYRREGDAAGSVLDTQLILDYGWKAKHSLEDSIRNLLKYYSSINTSD